MMIMRTEYWRIKATRHEGVWPLGSIQWEETMYFKKLFSDLHMCAHPYPQINKMNGIKKT